MSKSFFNKFAGLWPVTLFKNKLWHKFFLWILQMFKSTFFTEKKVFFFSRRLPLIMYLLVCYFLLGKWKMMHTSFETFRKKSYIYADLVSFTRLSFTAPCFLWIKVELSPSKKVCFICFNESLLKILKTCFSLHLESSFRFENI